MLGSVQMLSPGATGRPSLSSARGSARTRKATVVHATYKSSEKTENKPYAADKKAAVALLAGIATTCLAVSPALAIVNEADAKQVEAEAKNELQVVAERQAEAEAIMTAAVEGAEPQAPQLNVKAQMADANEEIKRMLPGVVQEVEAFVQAAVENERVLQAELEAREAELQGRGAEAEKLKAELEAAKVEAEKGKKKLEEEKAAAMAAAASAATAAPGAAAGGQGEVQPATIALQGTVGLLTAWGLSGYWKLERSKKKAEGALQAALDAVKDEGDERVKEMALDLQKAKALLEAANKALNSSKEEIMQAARVKRQLEEDNKAKDADIAALVAARQSMAGELMKLQDELQQAKMEIRLARQALDKERAATEQARAECVSLTLELSALQSEIANTASQNAELREQLAELETKSARAIIAAEKRNSELRRELEERRLADAAMPQQAPWWLAAAHQIPTNVPPPPPPPKHITVRFSLQRQLLLGQSHVLVGSIPGLGSWEVKNGLPMSWHEGHEWRTAAPLPAGSTVEFKCVRVDQSGEQWEDGPNHVLFVPDNGTITLEVNVEWGVGETVQARRVQPNSSASNSPVIDVVHMASPVRTYAASDASNGNGNGSARGSKSQEGEGSSKQQAAVSKEQLVTSGAGRRR